MLFVKFCFISLGFIIFLRHNHLHQSDSERHKIIIESNRLSFESQKVLIDIVRSKIEIPEELME